MPAAVIPAAGFSSRMGCFKPLMPVNGIPMILRTIAPFRALCSSIIVVTGYQKETIKALLAHDPQIRLVFNPFFAAGMFSSIQAGCRAITSTDRVFIHPGDMPLVQEQTLQSLLQATGDVVYPVCNGRRGHPVLVSSEIIGQIAAAPQDVTLKIVLAGFSYNEVLVDDPGVLKDFDVAADLK